MGYKVTRIMALILFLIMITATIPLGYAIEWSPDMRLTWNSEIDANPSIAQANDGKIWVVWHSYRTGNTELFYKVYDSSKVHPWSSEKNLTANPNADISPSIMQAQDGKIWVVWSTNRTGNYEIYYKTSSDNGATWSWPEKNLTANPKDDEYPSIMQVANGTIWLAWSANRTGNFDIYYKTSQDNGATWSTDKFLNYPATEDRNPSITQTRYGWPNGTIWFVWERDVNQILNIWYMTYYYDYIYNRWMWTGSTSRVTRDSSASNLNPSVTSAIDGSIWIAWDSSIGEAGQADIYYQTRSPPLFNAIENIQLTYNGGEDFTPSIMQAADETIWIAWTSWRTDSDIYYTTTKIPQPNDVAIFSVNCTEVTVDAGETVFIEVVAQNHGWNNTTPFLVRLYADLTLIGSNTTGLSAGQLYPLIFKWNALNTGTYKIWAKANVVYGEIYTVDNTFPAILGDVNSDRTVNASDVSDFSNAYGSKPGDSKWNPDCNFDGFNGDNKVDAFDLFDLGKNYGKSQ